MEHPHQQQLKVLALALGTLTALLREKGVLERTEAAQVFSIPEQLTPNDEEAGHQIINVMRQLAASIGTQEEAMLSED